MFIFLKGFSIGSECSCVDIGKDVFTRKQKHFENIEPRHSVSVVDRGCGITGPCCLSPEAVLSFLQIGFKGPALPILPMA